MTKRTKQDFKILPITRITVAQREWLDNEMNRTCESSASIVRGLIQKEINKRSKK